MARALCEAALTLEEKRGTLLFQLPPFFRKAVDRLTDFLDVLPEGARPAFEFRHASWHDPEVIDCLASRGAALCVSDSEKLRTPVEVTAPFAYFRLRDQGYTGDDLIRWADTIRARTETCDDVYIYFKHEEKGAGPEFAARLLEHLRA